VLIDRKSRWWMLGSLLALGGAAFGYSEYALHRPAGPSGASWPGLAFGIVGSAIILFCMLLSVRKMFRARRLGSAQRWMQAHVWLGLISYPIIWFHAGFRLGGSLTFVLMLLFTIVWLSGILGLLLQWWIPRLLVRDVAATTIYQQIDHVVAELRRDAERIVGSIATKLEATPRRMATAGAAPRVAMETAAPADEAAGVFRSLYESQVRPLLAERLPPRMGWGSGNQRVTSRFDVIRRQLPESMRGRVSELQELVRRRLQLERQRSLHRVLHGWLLMHVPLSYAMLLFSVVHAVMALRYSKLG
jgi:hypothetical protein